MKKFHSLLSALIILISCHNPEIKDKNTVHAHFSVGFETGAVEGRHLIEAITFPTVELFMTVFPVALDKELDPDTGLKLFHPEIHIDSSENKK
jgi:predicted DNA-binding protein with PD1-like motif